MAVYAQTFATSGFAGAGFKNFVNENEKIKCADNDLDTVRSSYFGGTAFSTKSNMNSVHNVYEARDTGDKKLAITSSKACGFATEGFANSGFKSDKPAAAKSFATLDAGSYRNQNQKNQDGNRNANPSTGLFTQKFAVSGAANKTRSHIHSEFTSCDHSNVDPIDISEQQSTMQYYSEMDTSDDFSAAELPLRYDALTGSYCIDTCIDHKNTAEKFQDCPQCCLAKYTLKIRNGKVELLEREAEDDTDYLTMPADGWEEKVLKKKSNLFAQIHSPY